MFDSVYARCPRCNTSVEFQSKAGECRLAGYSPDYVPVEIAGDLNKATKTCPKCNYALTLSVDNQIINVRMTVS